MSYDHALRLRPEQMLPAFSLPASTGQPVESWAYKQRYNLVVFLFDDRCPDCDTVLRAFQSNLSRYQALDARVIGVTTAPVAEAAALAGELGLDFPLASDPEATLWHKLVEVGGVTTGPQVGVLVTDRYGALYTAALGDRADELPTQDELLEWLLYVEVQCPECTVPEWPAASA